MSTDSMALFILYLILSYWAVGKIIYRHTYRYGQPHKLFFQQLIVGMLVGWILIPLAIVSTFLKGF